VDISTSGPASGSDVDPNGTTRFILRKTITKSTLGDCVLVFDHAVYRTDAAFITYILTVEKSLAASQGIVWNKLSEFVYDVHDPYYHNDPMPPKTAARLATAISKPLSVFYVAGHGGLDSRVGIPNDRFFEFGRYFFHSQPEGGAWSIYDISIHDLAAKAHYSWLSGNMPPALVFIDSCHSAGDSTQDATTKKYSFTRDVAYGDDFDIGDGAGAFVGWSGDCEYYGADPPPNNDWTMWRLDLWATFTAQGQDFGTDWETLVSDLDNHGRFWDVEPDDAMGPTCDWSAFTGFYR